MLSLTELYDALRPVRTSSAPVNPDVTTVTGYVAIDDVAPGTERAFTRRSRDIYLEWMRATLSIRQHMVIFVEPATREFVADIRRKVAAHTVIETVDAETLRAGLWYRETKRIMDEGHVRHVE